MTISIVGTPAYLSPEMRNQYWQYQMGNPLDYIDWYRSDVYALGITFIEMCFLEIPQPLIIMNNLQQNMTY